MVLYAFDVDETLEVSKGPVKLFDLVKLREHGHIVGLCGNWAMVTLHYPDWHHICSFVGPCGIGTERRIGSPSLCRFQQSARRVVDAVATSMKMSINPAPSPQAIRPRRGLSGRISRCPRNLFGSLLPLSNGMTSVSW